MLQTNSDDDCNLYGSDGDEKIATESKRTERRSSLIYTLYNLSLNNGNDVLGYVYGVYDQSSTLFANIEYRAYM